MEAKFYTLDGGWAGSCIEHLVYVGLNILATFVNNNDTLCDFM